MSIQTLLVDLLNAPWPTSPDETFNRPSVFDPIPFEKLEDCPKELLEQHELSEPTEADVNYFNNASGAIYDMIGNHIGYLRANYASMIDAILGKNNNPNEHTGPSTEL